MFMATRVATRTQHAVRLLALLRHCGGAVGGSDPEGAVLVIRSERRLQALDFWLRNPDYLADELVTAVEARNMPQSALRVAEALLSDPEPELRHYPMPKWFFGAYEAVDDAFALLEAYGLAFVYRDGVPPRRLRSQFFLTVDGKAAADEMATEPVLDWYTSQARLVAQVAGSDSGTRLKERQYAQEEYAEARWGTTIASIADQVRARLAQLQLASVAPTGPSSGGTT